MGQVEVLYQSVLQKLGKISPEKLAVLDNFLTQLVNAEPKNKNFTKKVVLNLAGAWKDWDEKEFDQFLNQTKEARESLFSDRIDNI